MATRLRNIVFCALAIVITCAAILYKIADLSEFLPEELDNGKRSYLEGADLQPLPEITLDGFVSGSLQDELESYFSGCWPARDSALLANASLQRSFISAAALPFGYDTWHTYYGSAQVYYAPQNALFETPDAPSGKNATLLEDAASAINELHEKHPDIKIVVAISDRSRITDANPLHSLSNNTADYSFFEKHFFGNLDEEITVVTQRKETPEEYFAYYFKSDHHWNIYGAYEMYESLCEELSIGTVEPTSTVEFPQMPFYGSIARNGLDCSIEDYITDLVFDLPEYQVWRNGKQLQRNHADLYTQPDESYDNNLSTYNGYGYYFGSDYDRLVYTNQKGEGSIMLIGDSYTQPIEKLLASHYSNEIVVDPRHFKGSLEEQISDADVQSIVLLMGSNTLLNSKMQDCLMR